MEASSNKMQYLKSERSLIISKHFEFPVVSMLWWFTTFRHAHFAWDLTNKSMQIVFYLNDLFAEVSSSEDHQ